MKEIREKVSLSFFIVIVILFFVLANRFSRKNPRETKREELIQTVEAFLISDDGAYDWDDFLTFPIKDLKMNSFRIECQKIDWTTKEGKDKIRELLDSLVGQDV